MTSTDGQVFYFCMDDVLETLERRTNASDKTPPLVRFYTDPISSYSHEEDSFVVDRDDNILDFSDVSKTDVLHGLTHDVPLYHINLELAIDNALSQAQNDQVLYAKLTKAFKSQEAIRSLKKIAVGGQDTLLEDSLNFPGIGYIYPERMCRIYIRFLEEIQNHERYLDSYGFLNGVLHLYRHRFLKTYDGYLTPAEGRIKPSWLLENGYRIDHEKDKIMDFQDYLAEGDLKARKENFSHSHDYLKAWLEADGYQLRRCRTMMRAARLLPEGCSPDWIRTDLLKILEKEAMKQHYAKCLMEQDPSCELLETRDTLREAVENNARGIADQNIEICMRNMLKLGQPEADSASKFMTLAESRRSEAQNI